jgi:GNAT superfamily N-acetyltransferase
MLTSLVSVLILLLLQFRSLHVTGVRVRPYTSADRANCLAVFDSNVPSSFTAPERPSFAAFLDELPGPYFVFENDHGDVVACGGYALVDGVKADLCWGMVKLDHQGLGLGRVMSEHRLKQIRAHPGVREVRMNTSQHTRAFYERLGFVTVTVTPDGFAPGLDRCDMILTLP